MKKLVALSLCVTMMASLVACGSSSSSTTTTETETTETEEATEEEAEEVAEEDPLADLDPVTLIIYTPSAAESVSAKTNKYYAELVSEASGGKITLETHDSSELGDDADAITDTRAGTIDIINAGASGFTSFFSRAQVLDLPFIFDSAEEAYAALNEGGLGEQVFEGFEDYGLVYLGMGDNGMRHISTTTKQIDTAADVEGLKIRVPTSQMYLDVWEALGATPVALALTELAIALSNGTAEAQDNATYHLVANATYDDIKYFSYINYMWMGLVLAVNADTFNALPEEYQTILKEQAPAACKYSFDLVAEDNAAGEATLIEAGVEFNYDPDIDSFKEKLGGDSYYDRYADEEWFDQDLLDALLAY